MIKAAILTISNSRATQDDFSGNEIKEILTANNFEITQRDIVKDDKKAIQEKLLYFSGNVHVIITTGGTGFGPHDVTPEATLEIIEKEIPGLPELMRYEGLKKTKRAVLSRGVSGIVNGTLIINLPGSPKGARESLEAVIDLLPHAVSMIKGEGH